MDDMELAIRWDLMVGVVPELREIPTLHPIKIEMTTLSDEWMREHAEFMKQQSKEML